MKIGGGWTRTNGDRSRGIYSRFPFLQLARVVEQGTHEDLVTANQEYASFYRCQAGAVFSSCLIQSKGAAPSIKLLLELSKMDKSESQFVKVLQPLSST